MKDNKTTMTKEDIILCFGEKFYYETALLNEIEKFIPDIRKQYKDYLTKEIREKMKECKVVEE